MTTLPIYAMRQAIAAALRRAQTRRELADMGFVPDDPDPNSREAFEDRLLAMALAERDRRERRVKHLRVIRGGQEGFARGRQPQSGATDAAVIGDKTPAVPMDGAAGALHNLETEEN